MKTQTHFVLRATICALALFSLLSYPLTVSAQTKTPPPTAIREFRLSLAKLNAADQKNVYRGMSPELKCAVWKDRIAEALEKPLKEKQRNVLLRIEARLRPEIYQADDNAEKTQFANFFKNLEKEAHEAFANEDSRLLVQILTQLSDNVGNAEVIQFTPTATSPDCECVQGGGWDDKCGIGFTCRPADCRINACGFMWWRVCNGMCVANPTSASAPATSTVRDGLRVVTFDTPQGRVIVNLPDDMRAGDTISGTVIAEPKGQTPEERAKNMGDQRIEIATAKKPDGTSDVNVNVSVTANPSPFTFFLPSSSPIDNVLIGLRGVDLTNRSGQFTGGLTTTVPIEMISLSLQSVAPLNVPFQLPTIGQQGRPVEIHGPFDGNIGTTKLMYGPAGSSIQDFEKNTENVSGGFGLIQPLAESPRKCVFGAPTNVTGAIELYLKEVNQETKGTYRNVGVNLTAPKTNLLKGESTELRVEVNGLQGLTQPVPLTLESHGVITMVGGNYQPLVIQPSQVGADGRYSTTRGITGLQTGGWTATGTVVTHKFDFCLQDDSSPQTVIQWNSFTGDYIFTPSGGTSLSGTGTVTRKDCIITLTDGRPDRKVQSTIDPCTQTGTASVQTSPPNKPKVKFTITDRNTANNTCSCGPGCR